MKSKLFVILMIFVFAAGFFSATDLMAQKKKKEKEEEEAPQQPVIIPAPVKAVFETGIQNRERRLDIPFELTDHLYLPTRENMHSIFVFKIKNSDLGFAPKPVEPPPAPEGEEAPAQEPPEEAVIETPDLQTRGHLFMQFNSVNDGTIGDIVKEVYVPFDFQIKSEEYDPAAEECYTVGYPLFPGNYLVSIAFASPTLEKIGSQYFEFTIPDMAAFTDTMEITPVFFTKDMERMTSPENQAFLHKGCLTYSVLKIFPSFNKEFYPGENLETMFFIFGTQPGADGRYQIEVKFSVMKGEEAVIRYAPGLYENPFISQPLPLKKTVVIKTTKGEETSEKKEIQEIEPGDYTLLIEITDQTSGNTLSQEIDFSVIEKE